MQSLINKTFRGGKDAADVQEGTGAIEEAPVVHERIHHHHEHADMTQEEDVRVKTHLETKVQPVLDQRQEALDTKVSDDGKVIREEGFSQLDDAARAEVARRHDEIAATAGITTDETVREVNERPDVIQKEKHRTIQQIQPVIERDIEVPHRVEHRKTDVKVVHEAPTFHGTTVAPAVTVSDWQKGTTAVAGAHTTTTGVGGASSSSSSSSEGGNSRGPF